MECDAAAAQEAARRLATEADPHPPDFLVAAYLSVVRSPKDPATTYSTSRQPEPGSPHDRCWSVLTLLGESVVRIKAAGPAQGLGHRPRSPELMQASRLDVTVNRFSALKAVTVAVDQVSREPFGDRGLRWC